MPFVFGQCQTSFRALYWASVPQELWSMFLGRQKDMDLVRTLVPAEMNITLYIILCPPFTWPSSTLLPVAHTRGPNLHIPKSAAEQAAGAS